MIDHIAMGFHEDESGRLMGEVIYARTTKGDKTWEVWGEARMVREFAPRGDSYEFLATEEWFVVVTDDDCSDLYRHLWDDGRAKEEVDGNGGAANRKGQVVTMVVLVSEDENEPNQYLHLFRGALEYKRFVKGLYHNGRRFEC